MKIDQVFEGFKTLIFMNYILKNGQSEIMIKVWILIIPTIVIHYIIRFACLAVMLLLLIGCTEDDEPVEDPNNTQTETGSWVEYSPYKWTHDGHPYYSVHCTVFSDGASNEIKELAGKHADDKFFEILEMFDFTNLEDLIYPTNRKEIDVYINTNHPENIAAAYWGSIFITVRGQELDTARYAYLFKHELTHQFEFLVEGTVNLAADMWFTEGIAIYCAGGLNRINTIEDLERWISENEQSPNKGNPITIRKWEDYPENADKTGYYTVFEIVVEYILDPMGHDKSLQDVLNVFYDLRELTPFEESFENNIGISVEDLELEIFDRLQEYMLTR